VKRIYANHIIVRSSGDSGIPDATTTIHDLSTYRVLDTIRDSFDSSFPILTYNSIDDITDRHLLEFLYLRVARAIVKGINSDYHQTNIITKYLWRTALDKIFGKPYNEVLDASKKNKGGAYKQLDDDQLRTAVKHLFRYMNSLGEFKKDYTESIVMRKEEDEIEAANYASAALANVRKRLLEADHKSISDRAAQLRRQAKLNKNK
jgi:beta-glucosidase-like glycosyl hydrolase